MQLQSLSLDPPEVDWPRRAVGTALRKPIYPGSGLDAWFVLITGTLTLGLMPFWRCSVIGRNMGLARARQLRLSAEVLAANGHPLAEPLAQLAEREPRPRSTTAMAVTLLLLSGMASLALLFTRPWSWTTALQATVPWSLGVFIGGSMMGWHLSGANARLGKLITDKPRQRLRLSMLPPVLIACAAAVLTGILWPLSGSGISMQMMHARKNDLELRTALAEQLRLVP